MMKRKPVDIGRVEEFRYYFDNIRIMFILFISTNSFSTVKE